MVDIVVSIIGMVSAVLVSVVSGIFSSRVYMKKQLSQAQKQADERHKHNRERTTATRHLIASMCRVQFWLAYVMKKNGAIENGELEELEKALDAVDQAEARLKAIERDIVAED